TTDALAALKSRWCRMQAAARWHTTTNLVPPGGTSTGRKPSVPSTTIRYSTLPENSQPTDLEDTPPPHCKWKHDLHTAPGREPEGAPGWMPGHELGHELHRELGHELGRELNREFDREFTRTWAGLHFERHQAEPEPETPAHGTPGSAMPDRNAPDPN